MPHRLIALLLLCALSPTAAAWSALGHGLVGELAGRHVQPATGRAIQAMLAGEPDPTLAGVADWADELRDSDPALFRTTSRWHYINLEEDACQYDARRDCRDGQCVVGAIQAQQAILRNRERSPAVRRDALKLLVHLVADAHQPLHAGGRDDKGGNRYQIDLGVDPAMQRLLDQSTFSDDGGTNLHAVWDRDVLASGGSTAKRYAELLATKPWPPVAVAGNDPAVWANESCRLVESRNLYPDSHVIRRDYLDAQRPLAELRIRQAAYRLTQLLDETLGR